MERQYPRINMLLIIMFIVMILTTTILTWYNYIHKEKFRVITNKASSPSSLDLSTY